MKQIYKKPVLQSVSIKLGVFGDYGSAPGGNGDDGGCGGGGHHHGGWGGWWGWWF